MTGQIFVASKEKVSPEVKAATSELRCGVASLSFALLSGVTALGLMHIESSAQDLGGAIVVCLACFGPGLFFTIRGSIKLSKAL